MHHHETPEAVTGGSRGACLPQAVERGRDQFIVGSAGARPDWGPSWLSFSPEFQVTLPPGGLDPTGQQTLGRAGWGLSTQPICRAQGAHVISHLDQLPPAPMASFYLNHLSEGSISKHSRTPRCWPNLN